MKFSEKSDNLSCLKTPLKSAENLAVYYCDSVLDVVLVHDVLLLKRCVVHKNKVDPRLSSTMSRFCSFYLGLVVHIMYLAPGTVCTVL
jgi:hypothetical protein